MRRAMLDTNAYAALLTGDEDVLKTVGSAEEVLLPIFVVGELEAGFRGGTRYADNVAWFRRFLAKPGVRVVSAGLETAQLFGEIKDRLKRGGTPVPTNDIWIAAAALEHAALLVTFDRHFAAIPQVRLWRGLDTSQEPR